MCIECHEALNVARSPESYSERAYLRSLIAQGLTAGQIKTQMVSAYGQAVLATPPASGFNLTIYILPPAIVLLGAAGLLFALPRWRRRSRAAAADPLTATVRAQPRRCAAAGRGPRPPRLSPAGAHIASGALTPSRPSASAIV